MTLSKSQFKILELYSNNKDKGEILLWEV